MRDRTGNLDPQAVLPFFSPITLLLVALSVAVVILLGGPWWAGALVGLVVYAGRVMLGRRLSRYSRGRPERIDPFALREPWRFHVRDALGARNRLHDQVTSTPSGPVRDRLDRVSRELDRAVEEVWATSRRAQEVSDVRRSIDVAALRREVDELDPLRPSTSERRDALEAQIDAAARLDTVLDETTDRLAVLDARLGEAVVRAAELATRSHDPALVSPLRDTVSNVVIELEALRQGLDEADGAA